MTRIMAVRLAMPLVLAIGLALPTDAQEPAFRRSEFACKIDLRSEIDGVPDTFKNVFTTFDTEKLCPANVPSENIKIDCFDELEGWPDGVSVSDNSFTCQIDGTACGIPEPATFKATTESITIQPRVSSTTGEIVGFVSMTCHFN